MQQEDNDFISQLKYFLHPIGKFPWLALFLIWYSLYIWIHRTANIAVLEYLTEALETSNQDKFLLWVYVLLWITVTYYFVKLFYKPRILKFYITVKAYLDELYLKKFITWDNNEIERIGTWRLISVVWKWTEVRSRLLESLLRDSVVVWSTILFSLLLIARKSMLLFFITFLILFLAYFWISYFGKKAFTERSNFKNIQTEMDRVSVRRYMSKLEIQSQDKMTYETQKRNDMYDVAYQHRLKEKIYQALGYDSVILLFGLVYIVWLTRWSWTWVLAWEQNISDFVVLTWLWLTVRRNVFRLNQELRRFMDGYIHVEKLQSLFDHIPTINWFNDWDIFTYSGWDVQLQDITYWYTDDEIFSDFSLNIKWWSKTALVWVSWSGKSTLVKLIAWYLRPDNGSIIVDGQDLTEVSLKSYYKHIWYLTQEPSVFDGTVWENLTYVLESWNTSEEADEMLMKRIDSAITHAKCEFVYDFPDGLHTEIWERGIRLSGWQRQRLAIAKIFLNDPKIIILDEPTSALDSFSEEAITLAMHNLFEWRTVIIIAHRLQTVKSADDIILLDEGEIIERWTHDQLVNKWEKYAKMLELQSGF